MGELVNVVRGVPLVSTMDMWQGLGVKHKALTDLIIKYESEFNGIRTLAFQSQKSGGRPTPFCMLDEEQATFLVTLMRNSPIVVKFKLQMTREFYKAKRFLSELASQQQNAQWIEQRNSGKIKRREETDTIQKFVTYAKNQGSTQAERYYGNITNMENKSLFMLEQKYPNVRNVLNLNQLSVLVCADNVVTKALHDGMTSGLNYRDIYILAKYRVEQFAEVHGKTLIDVKFQQPQLLEAA